jgi:polysaccharide export outer membrane protein
MFSLPIRSVIVSLVMLTLQACVSSGTYGGDPGISVAQDTALPVPAARDVTASVRPYLVGPFDKLKIDVFGVEELSNREVQTDASGHVAFPLVGTVDAAGRTPEEIARIIADRLRGKYVRDPQVSVNLIETLSQVVTVDGQVQKPGIYPVVGDMSLLRAIASAQGTTEYARTNNVVVFRTVAGQRYAGLYNLDGIRRGNYPDPAIYANDVVVVGESTALRRFDRFLQIVPLITSPLVLLLR